MISRLALFLALSATLSAPCARAQEAAPRDNPYDVIAKVIRPFLGVLLEDKNNPNKACTMTIQMTDVTGRLPKEMAGATLKAAVEFPDKVKLTAPVLGENITVCRNGDNVWATPGAKVEYLLKQFKTKPAPTKKEKGPLYLPITAQQAVFLPIIFSIVNADKAEVETVGGEECRVITAGLMPQLAEAAKAEGFQAQMWVNSSYVPRRITITQPDFTATVEITEQRFGKALVPATWEPPAGVTDIYRTNAEMLDAVLFVVMNSLDMKEGDAPWQNAKGFSE